MSMEPYVICQGDYLLKLAHSRGFDADAVWNHSANQDLQRQRSNPNMLAPGDILYVPTAPGPTLLSLSPNTSNSYTGKVPKVQIRITLTSSAGALTSEACVVEGAGDPQNVTSDGSGLVSFFVPVNVAEVRLRLTQRNLAYAVRIGHLDPVTENSGVRARLQHLGYLSHAPSASDDDGDAALANAISAFQTDQGITATGEMDDDTRGALVTAHGC